MTKSSVAILGLIVWTAIWLAYNSLLYKFNLLQIGTGVIDVARVLIELLVGSALASVFSARAVSAIQMAAMRH